MDVKRSLIPLLIFMLVFAACAPLPETLGQHDTLFQSGTLSALNVGDFEGDYPMRDLKRHGDFGLGTFNALDGEMIVLDGEIYQARDDGIAYVADDLTLTPFAAITYFEADQSLTITDSLDCAQLQAQIDAALPALDAPYAIKVSGAFATLQVRAPQLQHAPYPTLTDALADQILFDSENIDGTLVGFRLPDYLAGANATGYHFHFISDDKQHGGHVLACQTSTVTVDIDTITRIYLDVTPSQLETE